MIVPFIVIFFSLSSIGSSFTPKIEIDRCKIDTACFVRESCIVGKSTTQYETSLEKYTNELLTSGTCDVFLQIRAYSTKKFHVMIHVNSSKALKINEGIGFKQEIYQFRCGSGSETTENQKLSIVPFGDRRSAETNLIFCSFLLELQDSAEPSISSLFFGNSEQPEIIFTTEEKINSIKYRSSGYTFWANIDASRKCNPDIIKTKDSSNASHIFEKVDNTRISVSCAESRTLMVMRSENRIDYPSSLNCVSSEWHYKKSNGVQTEIVEIGIVNNVQETVEAYCVANACSLCEPLLKIECEGCTDSVYNNTRGDCSTSTCDNGLWRISEAEALPVKGEMKCDHKTGSQDQRQSVWYFTPIGENKGTELSKAACVPDAVCLPYSPYDLPTLTRLNCPNLDGRVRNCDPVQGFENKQDLYCRSQYQLRYMHRDKVTDATNITCNVITGNFTDESNNIVPHGSQIFCEPILEATTTSAPVVESSALSTVIIGGISLGIFIVIVVIGCALFRCYTKRRFRRQVKENEELEKKLKKEEEEAAELREQYEMERKMSFDERMDYEARKHRLKKLAAQ